MHYKTVSLKICELCGRSFTRLDELHVYCPPCAPRAAALCKPTGKVTHGRGRQPVIPVSESALFAKHILGMVH